MENNEMDFSAQQVTQPSPAELSSQPDQAPQTAQVSLRDVRGQLLLPLSDINDDMEEEGGRWKRNKTAKPKKVKNKKKKAPLPDYGYTQQYDMTQENDPAAAQYYAQQQSYYPQPEQTYQQPEQAYAQPEQVYAQPEQAYQQPEQAYQQPEQAYQQPEQYYQQPEQAYQQPEQAYRQPEQYYQQPEQYYQQPEQYYQQPEQPVEEDPTVAPAQAYDPAAAAYQTEAPQSARARREAYLDRASAMYIPPRQQPTFTKLFGNDRFLAVMSLVSVIVCILWCLIYVWTLIERSSMFNEAIITMQAEGQSVYSITYSSPLMGVLKFFLGVIPVLSLVWAAAVVRASNKGAELGDRRVIIGVIAIFALVGLVAVLDISKAGLIFDIAKT